MLVETISDTLSQLVGMLPSRIDWPTLLNPSGFLAGVGASLLATAIANTGKVAALLKTSHVPALRGKWEIRYQKGAEYFSGTVLIKGQFKNKVSGYYWFETPDHQELRYKFTGFFLEPRSLAITFSPKSRAFTDFGYALLRISSVHRAMHGSAISFDIQTGEPENFKLELARV